MIDNRERNARAVHALGHYKAALALLDGLTEHEDYLGAIAVACEHLRAAIVETTGEIDPLDGYCRFLPDDEVVLARAAEVLAKNA